MSNELLFLCSVLLDISFVFFCARRSQEWLMGSIATNLILVGVLGAKLITVFGLVTNVGNVFYACVFLAAHFLLERQDKSANFKALKIVRFGVAFMLFFVAMSQMAVHFSGLPLSVEANSAVVTLFSFSLHTMLASILAYIFAQHTNLFLYEWLKKRTKGKHLWLRSNAANIVSQLIDSLLFFSIAFFDLPGPILVQTILVGWLFKTVVVLIGTPFLYLDTYLEKQKS